MCLNMYIYSQLEGYIDPKDHHGFGSASARIRILTWIQNYCLDMDLASGWIHCPKLRVGNTVPVLSAKNFPKDSQIS
jgi:hypothetical protein